MSSRLFIKLREEQGLIYNINCSYDEYSYVGSFIIKLGTFGDTKSIMKCINIIIKELNDLKNNKIVNSELINSINYITGNFKINEENSENIANFYSEIILHKNNIGKNKLEYTTKSYIYNIKKVTINDIYNVSNEIFNYKKCNICILSKHYIKKTDISNILKL